VWCVRGRVVFNGGFGCLSSPFLFVGLFMGVGCVGLSGGLVLYRYASARLYCAVR
jgi:hypothetical protein